MSSNDEHLIGIFAPLIIFPFFIGAARFGSLLQIKQNVIFAVLLSAAVFWMTKGVWLVAVYPPNSKDVTLYVEKEISGMDPVIYTLLLVLFLSTLLYFRP